MKITQATPHQENSDWLPQLLLLFIWLTVGTILRFYQLESKPPWSDEFATLVFSLGHSFHDVSLNEIISNNTLLAPLQIYPIANVSSVIQNLMEESNHPPGFFILNHLWLKLFFSQREFISLWGARTLSTLLGIASIPTMFAFGTYVLRSRLIGQIAAALMAISPYGIYLAQEARHYTIAILLTISSLSCLLIVLQRAYNQTFIPNWLIGIWVIINSLGIGVHYFFILVLGAQSLSLLWLRFYTFKSILRVKYWRKIYAAVAGTLMGILVWFPLLPSTSKDGLTEWVHQELTLSGVIEPFTRIILWTLTMVIMLPVEGQNIATVVVLGLFTLAFLWWSLPWWIKGFRSEISTPRTYLIIKILTVYIIAAIALCLITTYGLGIDLTLAARYQFIYFPAILIFLAVSLAGCWQHFSVVGKRIVIVTLLMGLLGGLSVATHYAYQKSDRPDLVIRDMIKAYEKTSKQQPVLIATVHKTHEQTGEMMGLAWELNRFNQRKNNQDIELMNPLFLLAHKSIDPSTATETLHQTLTQLPRPLDVWIVNFSAPRKLETQGCVEDANSKHRVSGYSYRLYHCQNSGDRS